MNVGPFGAGDGGRLQGGTWTKREARLVLHNGDGHAAGFWGYGVHAGIIAGGKEGRK
jgi:hypothetical protein